MSSKLLQKLVIVAVIIALIIVFYVFDLGHYFTLSYLKASKEAFTELYGQHRILVIGIYMLIYIVSTSLSLPGAAVLTLGGGALFGVIVGTVIVSFASTIGATLACFFARFLFRDWVQNKFGDKLETVNRGIETEGSLYLFTLRLIPVFPFFVINLVMGLTTMPLVTFYWVSQVGMLAGTIVYVNAGKELAKIDSLSGIMSPSLIISFVILGIFPLTVKKLMGWY
ncbi:MAG: TVP38/TMEM64 family protein, partial [Deltaproteobacteria bacterium]|nr:TVP38/TMEM64 family protein [Deltaproteobacteria bacterium]